MSDDTIRNLYINPCYGCSCWNGDYGSCTMPETDRDFACDRYASCTNAADCESRAE